MKRTTETCPICRKDCWTIWEKRFILSYGKCPKCLLEARIGHTYIAPPVYIKCKWCQKLKVKGKKCDCQD
jgi:hypothetical protein